MGDDVICREGDLTIRRLRDDPADFAAMAAWRAAPHVHEWWDPDSPAPTAEEIADGYRERTEPGHATTACIIEVDGHSIGYIQYYRWASYSQEASEIELVHGPDSFGVDVHIGVRERIDRGIGSRAVALVCRHLAEEHGASEVLLMTELTNHRAQRAYERAGLVKIRHILDTDTRGGERVWCWLMRWTPTA